MLRIVFWFLLEQAKVYTGLASKNRLGGFTNSNPLLKNGLSVVLPFLLKTNRNRQKMSPVFFDPSAPKRSILSIGRTLEAARKHNF